MDRRRLKPASTKITMLLKWKNEEKEEKLKKQKKVISFITAFIFFLFFSVSLFKLYSTLKKSKVKNFGRTVFLVNSEQSLKLVFLNKDKLVTLNLPLNKKIKVTRGFGEYEIGKIYKLGELEKKGNELLTESIQESFALPIFGVIHSEKEGVNEAVFENFSKLSKSNFSFFDLVCLWLRIKKIPKTKETKLDLLDFASLDENGNLDFQKIDLYLGSLFKDEKIIKEDLTFSVSNSTQISGLGVQASRFIINLGGRVVNVDNTEEIQKTVIKSSKEFANSYSVKILQRIFSASFSQEEFDSGRSDISLFLGSDYWKKTSEKW